MSKAISYSLFGYNRERQANCFDFNSYLRGLHINIRFNRILFPEWVNVLNIDESTYNSKYKKIFDWHVEKGWLRLSIREPAPLCKSMLWRVATLFDYDHPVWRYSHVICRDLDSIATYREAQMVQQWVDEDRAIHCITDSVSHTIPMMGGMVGFRPGYVNDLLKLNTNPEAAWNKLLSFAPDIDYSRKGSDQDFLNRIIYPKCANNATEHFIKGRPHDLIEGNGRHYLAPSSIPDWIMKVSDHNLPNAFRANHIGWSEHLKQTNLLAGHIGAAGFYEAPTMKFLYWEDPYKDDYKELENMKEFAQIFYWSTRDDLR